MIDGCNTIVHLTYKPVISIYAIIQHMVVPYSEHKGHKDVFRSNQVPPAAMQDPSAINVVGPV